MYNKIEHACAYCHEPLWTLCCFFPTIDIGLLERSPYFDTTCFYKGFVKGELYLNVIHIAFKFILYMGVLT